MPQAAAADGATLNYTHIPATAPQAGVPIVWVHGLLHSADYWKDVLPQFPRHSHIAVDVRGHGRSTSTRGVSLSTLASDVAAVMRHAGVQRAVLVGHSMGGAVAQRFAIDFPKMTAGAVLVATSSRVGRGAKQMYIKLAEEQEGLGRFGVGAVQRAMSGLSLDKELKAVTAPILILCGSADKLTPVRAGEILRDALPGPEFVVVKDGGHDLLQTPEGLAPIKSWVEAEFESRRAKL
eukprot:Hpha_TRINITY_DN19652_c0_g1::TRINITY_DN19652_c0_g1_i1::g.186122::m.186122